MPNGRDPYEDLAKELNEDDRRLPHPMSGKRWGGLLGAEKAIAPQYPFLETAPPIEPIQEPSGEDWVIEPNELPVPPREEIKTQRDIQYAQLAALGLTRNQYLGLIRSRMEQTPPDIMEQYMSTGKRYTEYGYIGAPAEYTWMELGDVVGIKDLGLSPEFAHTVVDRVFPGLRAKGIGQQPSPTEPTFQLPQTHEDWLRYLTPELQPHPIPEGIELKFPPVEEGGEPVDVLLKLEGSLWVGKQQVGSVSPTTGEFIPKELPKEPDLWEKTKAIAGALYRETPISPYYWKAPEEKLVAEEKRILLGWAKAQGIEDPEKFVEEATKPRPSPKMAEFRPVNLKPGEERYELPYIPTGGVGEVLSPGERFIGEWAMPIAVLSALPTATALAGRLAAAGTAGKVISKALWPLVKLEALPGKIIGLPWKGIKTIKAKVAKPQFPEMPEPEAYLKALKLYHPERFKAKSDVDAIFKDIQQYNLLVREMGQNAPPALMARLTATGQSTNLFKLNRIAGGLYDVTVRAPYIKPRVKGASMAISDIMQNPNAYRWIGKEGKQALRFSRAFRQLEQELLSFEKKYGIPIKEKWYPAGQYHIGRNVVAEVDGGGNVILERTLRRGRLGTKLSAERERWYATQAEGIKAGKVYALPEESIQFRIQSAMDRAGGLKIKTQYIDTLSATPAQMMDANIKQQWGALSRNYKDALYIGKALQRIRRGEKLPSATLKAIARRSPTLAKQLEGKPKIAQLIKTNNTATQVAKTELRNFAPLYHRATAQARQAAFTEGRIWGFPAMQNRIFGDIVNPHNPKEVLMTGREFVTKLNEIFGPDRVNAMVATASDMARVGVALTAAMDGSWPSIQGPMILGADASLWARGRPSVMWAKSTFEMLKTMVNPKYTADFLKRHAATYAEAPLIIQAPSEFVWGYGVLSRWADKVPLIGGGLTKIINETYGRMGAGFSGAALASRTLYYETMKKSWVKHGGDLVELQLLANQISGAVSLRYLGVSAQEAARESALLFAPSFTRAWVMNIRDLARGTMKAREIQMAMAGMFASMFGSYITICALLGKEPKLNPAPISVGGDGAQFLSIEIGGVNVGAPGWGYSLLRLAGNVAAVAATNPESLLKVDMSNPTLRAIFSKASPLVGLAKETASQRDYFGNRLETGGDWVVMLADKVIPIAAQSLLEKTPESDVWVAVGAELFGVRTYPVQPYERLARMREDLASEQLDREGDPYLWDELPSALKDEIRRKNPEFKQLEEQISEEWAMKRGTDNERTVYQVKQEVEQEFIDNLTGLTDKLQAGAVAPDEYRRQVQDIRGERSLQKDLLWRLHEIGEPDEAADYDRFMQLEAPIEDQFLHSYWTYWEQLMEWAGPAPDWDVVNRAMDKWLNSINPYFKDYIIKYRDGWVLDLPQELQAVISPMLEDGDFIEMSGYWKIDPETPEGRQARIDMRQLNPRLDAALILWYAPEVARSPEAIEIIRQKANELGIPAIAIQALTPTVAPTGQKTWGGILGQ